MIEQFDILSLSNGKKYTVAEQLNYKSKDYLLLIAINNEEKLLEEQLVVEKVKTTKGYGVKPVKDQEILEYVNHKFIEMINKEN